METNVMYVTETNNKVRVSLVRKDEKTNAKTRITHTLTQDEIKELIRTLAPYVR